MAILERRGTKIRLHLLARHLVGRSSLADLRLADPSISSEHAVMGWDGLGWEVRDLGSRNGTIVDGRRLASGERAAIARGSILTFGSAASAFQLVDDGPPVVLAIPLGSGEPVCGEHDLLALPSGEAPEVTVYRDAAAEWVLDRDGEVLRAANGDRVRAGGRDFTLRLPDVVPGTMDIKNVPLSLDAIALAFEVSRDEEHVALTARTAARTIDLGARAHHVLLLALARARLRDAREALSESSHGWVYQEEVAKGLGLDEPHMNVTLFRCRQHLASAGIAGAAGIVERRKSARQIRIGVGRIEIAIV